MMGAVPAPKLAVLLIMVAAAVQGAKMKFRSPADKKFAKDVAFSLQPLGLRIDRPPQPLVWRHSAGIDAALGSFFRTIQGKFLPRLNGQLQGKLLYLGGNHQHSCSPPCNLGCQDLEKVVPSLDLGQQQEQYILLLDRGPDETCKFAIMAWNAQNAGAKGVLIVNSKDDLDVGDFLGPTDFFDLSEQEPTSESPGIWTRTTLGCRNVTIPAALISSNSGEMLKTLLEAEQDVRVSLNWAGLHGPQQQQQHQQDIEGACSHDAAKECKWEQHGDQGSQAKSKADSQSSVSGGSGLQFYGAIRGFWDAQVGSDVVVLGTDDNAFQEADIRDSEQFLKKVLASHVQKPKTGEGEMVAVDLGAGIGRVAEKILVHHFHEIDLVEQSESMLSVARQRLDGSNVNFIHLRLQDFAPEEQRYDLAWVQLALMYLTDEDAVALLRRCARGLKPGGLLVVKEGALEHGFVDYILDKPNHGFGRSRQYILDLAHRAGLELVDSSRQSDMAEGFVDVYMLAFKPAQHIGAASTA